MNSNHSVNIQVGQRWIDVGKLREFTRDKLIQNYTLV